VQAQVEAALNEVVSEPQEAETEWFLMVVSYLRNPTGKH